MQVPADLTMAVGVDTQESSAGSSRRRCGIKENVLPMIGAVPEPCWV